MITQLMEMLTGERRVAAGVPAQARSGAFSEQIVNDVGLGRFFEGARLGRLFYTQSQAITIAATHNTPLAAATGTPIVGFFNPPNSSVAAVILQGWFASISGTPPAQAHPVWNYAVGQNALTVTPAGTISSALASAAAPSQMKCYSNLALTGLNIAAGNLAAPRPFGLDTFAGAMAANASNGATDNVDGALIIPPGTVCGIFSGVAAGTTWVVSAGALWAEVPWPHAQG